MPIGTIYAMQRLRERSIEAQQPGARKGSPEPRRARTQEEIFGLLKRMEGIYEAEIERHRAELLELRALSAAASLEIGALLARCRGLEVEAGIADHRGPDSNLRSGDRRRLRQHT